MKQLDINLVFKVRSVEELGRLYMALKESMTLQEKLAIENEIKKLKERKKVLSSELEGIKNEIHELCPDKKLDSEGEDEEAIVEPMPELIEEETSEEAAQPIGEETETEVFIEHPTEEAVEEDNVQSDNTPRASG